MDPIARDDAVTPLPSPAAAATGGVSFTSPIDLTPDIDALLDLCRRGLWRAVLDRLSRPKPHLLPPHRRPLLLSLSALALFKLRRFSDASAALSSLLDSSSDADPGGADPFDSPRFRFESYPDFYPDRRGSFVPFSARLVHALLPGRLGDRALSLDRLYALLSLCRSRAGAAWSRRAVAVASALFADHFANRELDVALALLHDLLESSPSDPVLLSRLGYVHLQLGDVTAAANAFALAESLPSADDNLAGRNRALGQVVAKNYAAAARGYESCLELDPTDAVAINNKALCLMYSRDLGDAIRTLEGAMELMPTAALDEKVVVNLCSMYELAHVNHADRKRELAAWIAKVAPNDFDPSCTRV